MKKINILYLLVFTGFISFTACGTDDLDPTLAQEKSVEGSIGSVDNLYGIIKGAYSILTGSGYYGRDYIVTNEVRTDNCFSNGNSGRFTTQASFSYDKNTGFIWDNAYAAIASANIIINTDIEGLSGDLAYGRHLQGQSLAIRALCHYDLLTQYGQMHSGGTIGIPLVLEFKGDDLFPSRNSIEETKNQILADLELAFNLMDDDYYDSSKEFFNKYAAKALEARVRLYFNDFSGAEAAAKAVIGSNQYSVIAAADFVASFNQNASSNSIFELAFNLADTRGGDSLGYMYKTGDIGSYGDCQVLDEVAAFYDTNDVRGDILGYELGSPRPTALRNLGKFPDINGVNNVNLIRYEEVVLIEIEAMFMQSNSGPALLKLNALRAMRNAPLQTNIDRDIILDERRAELMFEGFRYDDLMRTGKDIEYFSLQQNITEDIPYGDFRLTYPIPAAEMNANSNMEQNRDY